MLRQQVAEIIKIDFVKQPKCGIMPRLCTRSSVGRVSASEAEGRWFDPSRVRQFPTGRLNFFRRPVVFLLFQDSLRRAISACLLPKFALSYALFTFLNTLRSKRDFETRKLSPARSVRVP